MAEVPVPAPVRRNKLGLALAGGGFRAALFHLGVLHRLAELDMLRRVEVLSTVSGGSIIGALYVLLLKRELERPETNGTLNREGYVKLLAELDRILVAGIRRNLRGWLLANPLGVLRVLLTPYTLSRRMSRLYERHLLAAVVRDLEESPQLSSRARVWRRLFRPGRLRLEALRIRPGGNELAEISAYNDQQLRDREAVVTALVLNATSLNSGDRFWFSSSEVGDAHLGAFRADEAGVLRVRKRLLENMAQEEPDADPDSELSDALLKASSRDPVRTVSLARWWWQRGWREGGVPDGWESLFEVSAFPGGLPEADPGLLRSAKVAAWYLRDGLDPELGPLRTGGYEPEMHRDRLFEALKEIDRKTAESITAAVEASPNLLGPLLDFVLELYWLRTAERVSHNFDSDVKELTVADAVGASACFPPVFAPFVEHRIYDDAFVSRLSLTDGGVFDNIGLTALLDEGCTEIIASDTGGLFHEEPRAPADHVRLSLRLPSILMRTVGGLQKHYLRERRRASHVIHPVVEDPPSPTEPSPALAALRAFHNARRLDALAYFHIDSQPVAVISGPPALELLPDRRHLALLRTDLDAFGDVEIAALVNHGYATADRYVRRFMPADVPVPALRAPKDPVGSEQVDRILRAGRSRFFRALKLRAPVTTAVGILTIFGPAAAAWRFNVSAGDVLAAASTAIGWWISAWISWWADGVRWLLSQLPDPVISVLARVANGVFDLATSGGLPLALLLGIGAGAWGVSRLPRADTGEPLDVRRVKSRRRRRLTWEWAWGLKWNLLWLVGAPLVLAVLGPALSWAGRVVSGWPFLRKTRIRPSDIAGSERSVGQAAGEGASHSSSSLWKTSR